MKLESKSNWGLHGNGGQFGNHSAPHIRQRELVNGVVSHIREERAKTRPHARRTDTDKLELVFISRLCIRNSEVQQAVNREVGVEQ